MQLPDGAPQPAVHPPLPALRSPSALVPAQTQHGRQWPSLHTNSHPHSHTHCHTLSLILLITSSSSQRELPDSLQAAALQALQAQTNICLAGQQQVCTSLAQALLQSTPTPSALRLHTHLGSLWRGRRQCRRQKQPQRLHGSPAAASQATPPLHTHGTTHSEVL